MFLRFTLTTIAVAIVAAALIFTKLGQFHAMAAAGAAMTMPAETVTAAPVEQATWENSLSATGSVVAVQGVTVAAEVAGKVVKIAFEPGAKVAAGDLLVQLDTSTEEAQLRAADASAALAKTNLERAKELREKETNSQADLDASDAQAKQTAAQADNLRAVVAKKTIRAPFSGRLGLRLVNLGQVLREGDPIASLQTLDPIFVNFSMPQQRLSQLANGAVVRVTTDAAPGKVFEGKVTAINPDVDPATRNVRIQATLGNADELLHPGMFANVDVVLPEKQAHMVIPVSAVLYAPYGDSVFVIDEKKNEKSGETEKVLRQQFIRLGPARGDFVAVESGLKAGESIVTSGAFKLRPGITVTVDNTLAPKPKLDPKPNDT